MLATSQKWKDNINRDDRICLGYITLDDTIIQDDLFEYSIDDTIDSEGFIGTFVKKKCTLEVLNKENKYAFDNRKIKVYAGLQYEDNTDEYVFLGTYVVTKASYDNVNYSSKLETYDLSTLFDVRFVNNVEYPCTIRKYVEECCKIVGVHLSADEFNLQNMILEEQPYLPEGATFRDAIKQVAQTCLSCAQIINDELHITTVLKPNTNTLTSSNNQYAINDGANSDVRKLIVNGKSTQETSTNPVKPSPDNPSEVETVKGKNLYGNITWKVQTYAYFQLPTLNEDYTLSLKLKEGKAIPAGLYVRFTQYGYYDKTQKFVDIISNGTQVARFINNKHETAGYLNYLSVYTPSYKDTLEEYFDIQLEKGSLATNYVPYNNVQIKNVGHNIFNKNETERQNGASKTILDTGVRAIVKTAGQYRYFGIKLGGSELLGKTITWSRTMTPSGENKGQISLYFGNENSMTVKNIGGFASSGVNSTYIPNVFPDNTNYIFVLLYANGNGTGNVGDYVDYTNLMFTVADNINDYEDYQESITNIDLQGNELCSLPNNIKDKLIIENNRAKIIKTVGKYILDGTQNIYQSKELTNSYRYHTAELIHGVNNISLSNYFVNSTIGNINSVDTQALTVINSTQFVMRVNKSIATTVAEFKTWLSTHNTIVYYQLATPIEIDLGEVENLKSFNGDNNILIDINMNTETLLEYKSNENVQKIDFELDDYFDLTTEEKIGPYNVLVLGRSPQEDNLYFPVILPDNPYEYRIDNNQIVDKHREVFGPVMLNYIEGLEFIPHEVSLLKGRPDISPLDYFKFMDMENVVKQSIIFTHNFKFDGNFTSKISAASKSKTQTNYKRANTLANRMTTTELEVDKAKGEIKAVVSTVQETESTIQSIITTQNSQQLTIEAITEKTSKIDEEGNATSVKTGTGFTFNDAGLNISEVGGDGFNSQFTPIGSYYKDGDEVISMTTKDGSTLTNLNLKGQTKYSYNNTDYDFVDERVDADGEYCYATFYNGEE